MRYRCPECGSESIEACLFCRINWDMNNNCPAENDPIIFPPNENIDQSDCPAWCLKCEWRGEVVDLAKPSRRRRKANSSQQ